MKKDEEIKILKKIYESPSLSQRNLAKDLGFSLGKLNYGLKNLQKRGLVKRQHSLTSTKKLKSLKYSITNKGKSLNYLNDQNVYEDKEVKIFKRKTPFLIAEIGINHNGSLTDAKKLIKLAKKYDFNAVKFQKRDLDICIPENQKKILRETPWGLMSYLDYKKKIELSLAQYKDLKKYADKIGIEMFASCWDIKSLQQIKRLKFKYNKIASAMITNLKFLNEVAKEKKKTFISTGMCVMKDIEKAVDIFKSYKCEFVLMHSVSIYPCDESLLNLNLIRTYKKKFNCEIGYSGHESSVSPSITAFFLGANYIERHITLDRASWGTDQAASLAEAGIDTLTSLLRKIPITVGDGKKKFLQDEIKVSKKMRYWEKS